MHNGSDGTSPVATPVATVLVPTHNHGATLYTSVASALRQTVSVEVFVIGDGATEETRSVVHQIAASDARVRFFDRPKGPRHGEAYRHEALQEARGKIVCYLSDDDLYLPHHVEEMSRLLEDSDFAHALAVQVHPDETVSTWNVDLALPVYRQELLQGRNRIPLSAGAHTLACYRSLPEGWAAAPPGIPTDLHMWQKFLRMDGCKFRAGTFPTVLVFPDSRRRSMNHRERVAELHLWDGKLREAEGAAALERQVLEQKTHESNSLDSTLLAARLHGGEILQPDFFQIFVPRAGGYLEENSIRIPLEFSTWQKIHADLARCAPGQAIRIDPASQPCIVELANIRMYDGAGNELWRLSGDTAHQLLVSGDAVAISRGPIVEILSDGVDPRVQLPVVTATEVRLEASVRLNPSVQALAKSFGRYLRSTL